MSDLSLAERGFIRIRRRLNEMQLRPAGALAGVVGAGAVIAMAAALANASSTPGVTFTFWVSLASAGFGLRVQLALVVAALLLVLDSSSRAFYPGRRLHFGVLVVLGGAGIGMDLLALIVLLALGGAPSVGAGKLAAGWAAIVCGYLAPVSLGALVCFVGVHEARSVSTMEEAR